MYLKCVWQDEGVETPDQINRVETEEVNDDEKDLLYGLEIFVDVLPVSVPGSSFPTGSTFRDERRDRSTRHTTVVTDHDDGPTGVQEGAGTLAPWKLRSQTEVLIEVVDVV